MNASFEEKSVWIQLVSMVAVLGSYFVVAALMLSEGVTTVIAFVAVFMVAVGLMVVVLVVGHIVVAIASRPEGRDERDRLIEWRAESNSSWILDPGCWRARRDRWPSRVRRQCLDRALTAALHAPV